MAHASAERIRRARQSRQWSQAELARRAGVSRAEISAIESGRLVPSVAAALAIARALTTSVEELFAEPGFSPDQSTWVRLPSRFPVRFWHAAVGNRIVYYPAGPDLLSPGGHDGVALGEQSVHIGHGNPRETLVVATCDPAAPLLAEEYAVQTGFRMLILVRSSAQALKLLNEGLVHVAGLHVATPEHPEGNLLKVRATVGTERAMLLRTAQWEEGVVVGSRASIRSIRGLARARLRWIGREEGSAARECLEQVLGSRRLPRSVAFSHSGVVEAVRCGWADAGVCVRACGEEAGLRVLTVRREQHDLCFLAEGQDDPRIAALIRVVQSRSFRRRLHEVPGYDASEAGLLVSVGGGEPAECSKRSPRTRAVSR